ncbi:MAG: AAA family ATPase [Chloroflexota bacterium]
MTESLCPECESPYIEIGPDGATCKRGHQITRGADGLLGSPSPARGNSGELPRLPITTIRLSAVKPERVRWLWPQRLPLGKLAVIDGDPGLGKSAMTTDLAARVSKGSSMPDGSVSDLLGAWGVVLLSAEDGLGDTIRPRLEAAGADLERIVALTAVADPAGERMPTLRDLPAIRAAIAEVDARLVVVDPVMAYLDDGTNAHKDQDVRRLLAPLAALAEETGAAFAVVRHLNKSSGGNPLYRGGGSIGIIGAARSGLLVAKDPDDETGFRRIIVSTKSNLSAPPAALIYHLEESSNGAVRVVWDGTSAHTAQSVTDVSDDAGERGAVRDAVSVIRDVLMESGGQAPAKDVIAKLREAGVYGEGTYRRARKELKVKARKRGMTGGWVWEMESEETPKAHWNGEGSEYSNPKSLQSLREISEPSEPPACPQCGGGFALNPRTGLCDDCGGAR